MRVRRIVLFVAGVGEHFLYNLVNYDQICVVYFLISFLLLLDPVG